MVILISKKSPERSDPLARLVGEANQRVGRLMARRLVQPVFMRSMKEEEQNSSTSMPNRLYFFAAILLLATPVRAGQNSGSDLGSMTAFDVRTHKKVTLFNPQQASMFSFFEPDCGWCLKQIKALDKLQQNCEAKWNIVLVGVNGSKQQLRRLLQTSRSQLPAIQQQRRLRQQVGKITATPTNVFFNNQQQLISKQRGFIDYSKLLKILAPDCVAN